jgi:hypothetical protein
MVGVRDLALAPAGTPSFHRIRLDKEADLETCLN